MTNISRRRFVGAASTALMVSPTPAHSKTDGAVGPRLFGDYFSLHFPTVRNSNREQDEIHSARRAIRSSVTKYLEDLVMIFGLQTIEERLADVAKFTPIGDGFIPIAYVTELGQSHNLLAGIPYTGVYIGGSRDWSFIPPHEVGHVVFGKFNDGLTEPVASLFVNSVRKRPSLNSTENPAGRKQRIPLYPNEAIFLAILELWEDGIEISDARSLSDHFLHQPSYRLVAQARYEYELKIHDNNERLAAEATNGFLSKLIGMNYQQDFPRHDTLSLCVPTRDEGLTIDDWLRRSARFALASRSRNPNESRGPIRTFQGFFDSALAKFLLEAALPGDASEGSSEKYSPEQAREAIAKFLKFYFNPHESVRLYGHPTLQSLESEMLEQLRFRAQPLKQMPAWHQLKLGLATSPCYQPETWNAQDCLNIRGPGPVVDEFLQTMRPILLPGGSPSQNPIVKRALMQPDGVTRISLVEELGQDLNFKKYFELI